MSVEQPSRSDWKTFNVIPFSVKNLTSISVPTGMLTVTSNAFSIGTGASNSNVAEVAPCSRLKVWLLAGVAASGLVGDSACIDVVEDSRVWLVVSTSLPRHPPKTRPAAITMQNRVAVTFIAT